MPKDRIAAIAGLVLPLVAGLGAGAAVALLIGCGSWIAPTVEGALAAGAGILAAVIVGLAGCRIGWWE